MFRRTRTWTWTWTWLTALTLVLSSGLPSTSASASASNSSTSTGIVEIDLISPRNQTYPPSGLLPIVFAIQNTELLPPLSPSLTWYIESRDTQDENEKSSERIYTTGSFDLVKELNDSSPDPFFVFAGTSRVSREGHYAFSWEVDWFNCSANSESGSDSDSNNNNGDVTLSTDARRYSLFLTAHNDTKAPDLVAATSDDTCKDTLAHAWDVSQLLDAPERDTFEGGGSCAVLDATTLPDPTPCKVKIDENAEESMQAVMTERACAARETPSGVECPVKEGSAPAAMRQISVMVVVGFAGLAYYLV